jgi:hypothetical protein
VFESCKSYLEQKLHTSVTVHIYLASVYVYIKNGNPSSDFLYQLASLKYMYMHDMSAALMSEREQRRRRDVVAMMPADEVDCALVVLVIYARANYTCAGY